MPLSQAPAVMAEMVARAGWGGHAALLTPQEYEDVAFHQLTEELCDLYVPGMGDEEYADAERLYWQTLRTSLQATGVQHVGLELLNARTDLNVQLIIQHMLDANDIDVVPDPTTRRHDFSAPDVMTESDEGDDEYM